MIINMYIKKDQNTEVPTSCFYIFSFLFWKWRGVRVPTCGYLVKRINFWSIINIKNFEKQLYKFYKLIVLFDLKSEN